MNFEQWWESFSYRPDQTDRWIAEQAWQAALKSRPEERASYDPVSGKCRGDCDCSIGQTCKAYLVYKQRTMNSGGEKQ